MPLGDNRSSKELNRVSFLLKYRAVKLCAPKERLTIFRKRAVESFGNMPECSHNWARDTGNSNFGRGIFWKCISDQLIPPLRLFNIGRSQNINREKSLSLGGSQALSSLEEAFLIVSLLLPILHNPSFALLEPPAIS